MANANRARDDINKNDNDLAADIEMVLAAVEFPATREDILDAADDSDVNETIMVILEDLPDQQYGTSEEARTEVNKRRATHSSRKQ